MQRRREIAIELKALEGLWEKCSMMLSQRNLPPHGTCPVMVENHRASN